MRPLSGDEVRPGGRSSRSNSDNEPTPMARHPPQMTYFMTDENSIGQSHSPSPATYSKQLKSAQDYSVESLETVISSLSEDSGDQEGDVRKARKNWKKKLGVVAGSPEDDMSEPISPTANDLSRNVSPFHERRPSQAAISRPFTPLSFGSPTPASIIGSPYSRRTSDAGSYSDELASQAIVSSGDEEQDVASDLVDSGSAPQLVMPTMKMPGRRPFTEKGKNLGRLKVLIAGDSGMHPLSLHHNMPGGLETISFYLYTNTK